MSQEPHLIYIDPKKIEPNKYNPRRLFDDEELKLLQESIKDRGVLVPLTVYRKKKGEDQFVLLDGDRRLRCVKKLNLKQVPANEIAIPDPETNLILMFNIHNVRKDWEFVPTALAIERLIKILEEKQPKKIVTNAELSRLTSISAGRIGEYRRALKYKKYFELALMKEPKERIGGDFFSQLDFVMDKLDNYPEITKEIPRDKIIDIMIEKKQEGVIVNMIKEFRLLKNTLDSDKRGVPKQRIINNVTSYIKSKPVYDKQGKVKAKAMAMEDLYEETSQAAYTEKEIIKLSKQLQNLLDQINYKEVHDKQQFRNALQKLVVRINALLK